MGTVKSHLRRLRLEYATQRAQNISVQEVADATNIRRDRLTNLELGKFDRITTEELTQLCAFYSRALGRTIRVGDIIDIDKISPGRVAAPLCV